MKEDKGYPYLNRVELSALSDSERDDYYKSLSDKREEAYTYEQKQLLANAYFAFGDYADAPKIAAALYGEAEEQKKADEDYNTRKFRMGIIVISAICAAVMAAAVIITLISMG